MSMVQELLEMRRIARGGPAVDHRLEGSPPVLQNVMILLGYGEFEEQQQEGRHYVGFRFARWQSRVDVARCDKAVIGCDAQSGARIAQ